MFEKRQVMNNNKVRVQFFPQIRWPANSKSSQRRKKAEIRNFHKFPFAGSDRPWFPQFFYCILGGLYKFCWCIRGKVEGGRWLNEGRYPVLAPLFRSVLFLSKKILRTFLLYQFP